MEIIYRSFDGKTFSTPEECLNHEKENPLFRMFDISGKQVAYPDDCILLQIVNESDGPAAFVKLCESYESNYEGFSSYESAGWYWWDGDEYHWIDPEMVNALFKCGYYQLSD